MKAVDKDVKPGALIPPDVSTSIGMAQAAAHWYTLPPGALIDLRTVVAVGELYDDKYNISFVLHLYSGHSLEVRGSYSTDPAMREVITTARKEIVDKLQAGC